MAGDWPVVSSAVSAAVARKLSLGRSNEANAVSRARTRVLDLARLADQPCHTGAAKPVSAIEYKTVDCPLYRAARREGVPVRRNSRLRNGSARVCTCATRRRPVKW